VISPDAAEGVALFPVLTAAEVLVTLPADARAADGGANTQWITVSLPIAKTVGAALAG